MKLTILLFSLIYAVSSFSSEDAIFNLHNNTDNHPISFGVLFQAHKVSKCLSPLLGGPILPTNTASFPKDFYSKYCTEEVVENGKKVKNDKGGQLYYPKCYIKVYASNYCTGDSIGSITLDRDYPSTRKYVTESIIKNIRNLFIHTRSDEEFDIYNTKVTKGYVLLKSINRDQNDIEVKNAIYYMINNKSNSFLTIGVNSPCEVDLKIGGLINSPLPPGNSIWSIPNFWLFYECKFSNPCSVYLYEVIKLKGQKGTCGNMIGSIDVDLINKTDELISLYDNRYQLSIQPVYKSSIKVRRAITITNN
ncbi:hypothetical protein SC588_06910 [Legionella pneumophila]|nr:hypothetical protein [Legionella pneumophila]